MSSETPTTTATTTTKVKSRRKKTEPTASEQRPEVSKTRLAWSRNNLGFLLRNPWFWLITAPLLVATAATTAGCHKPSTKAEVVGTPVAVYGPNGTKVIFDTDEARYEFTVPTDIKVDFTSATEYRAFQDAVRAERLEAQAEFMRQYSQLVETQLTKLEEESNKAKGSAELSAAQFINGVRQQHLQEKQRLTQAVNKPK